MGQSISITVSSQSLTLAKKDALATPLVCNTDLRPCCRMGTGTGTVVAGHWYYPNGTEVPGNGPTEGKYDLFRIRGLNDGTVNMFRRRDGIISPFGQYCCEIPDNKSIIQTLCVNIGKKMYELVCTIDGVRSKSNNG